MTLCAILSRSKFNLSMSVASTMSSDGFDMLDVDKLIADEDVDGCVSWLDMDLLWKKEK